MSAGSDPRVTRTRQFLWSARRELWEYHSLYLAPLAVATLVLVAFVIGTLHLPHIMISSGSMNKMSGPHTPPAGLPYAIATTAVLITGVLVAIFYCLGALHNERRDRSILFWKSLPVSDGIVVLAKASIPLAIVPAIIFAITLLMQLIMMIASPAIIQIAGVGMPVFWRQWSILTQTVVLLYGLVTLSLWLAPIYAWLLLVSAWARKVPFLWGVVPPVALCLAEKIAFDTSHLATLLSDRLFGSFDAAFTPSSKGAGMLIQLSQLAPLQFLRTPGLWIGLAVTATLLAAAIRLRRYGGPI